MTGRLAETATASLANRLGAAGVVPVLVIRDASDAIPLAQALLDAGLGCLEVTFRTAAAADAIRRIRDQVPAIDVGAGTVLTVEQADAAMDAGATFVVAPGTNPAVIDRVTGRGIPMLPGAATPTEVEALLARGIDLVKFFPAEPMGGIRMLQALAGPYPGVRFVPTGGIGLASLDAYLRLTNVVACGGSWMATPDQISAHDWEGIGRAGRDTVRAVRQARTSGGNDG